MCEPRVFAQLCIRIDILVGWIGGKEITTRLYSCHSILFSSIIENLVVFHGEYILREEEGDLMLSCESQSPEVPCPSKTLIANSPHGIFRSRSSAVTLIGQYLVIRTRCGQLSCASSLLPGRCKEIFSWS